MSGIATTIEPGAPPRSGSARARKSTSPAVEPTVIVSFDGIRSGRSGVGGVSSP